MIWAHIHRILDRVRDDLKLKSAQEERLHKRISSQVADERGRVAHDEIPLPSVPPGSQAPQDISTQPASVNKAGISKRPVFRSRLRRQIAFYLQDNPEGGDKDILTHLRTHFPQLIPETWDESLAGKTFNKVRRALGLTTDKPCQPPLTHPRNKSNAPK